jgi:hypothetical protein
VGYSELQKPEREVSMGRSSEGANLVVGAVVAMVAALFACMVGHRWGIEFWAVAGFTMRYSLDRNLGTSARIFAAVQASR